MNAMAVDMEVLSINPFWYRKERDLAAEIVAQLETAMKKQGLRGAAIGGSVAGADFSEHGCADREWARTLDSRIGPGP